MPRKLLRPDEAVAELARRYERQHLQWWRQGDAGALTLALGTPTENEVAADPAAVRAWVEAWQSWRGPAEVRREVRRWPRLGEQCLPVALVVASATALADVVGAGPRWRRAVARRAALQARFSDAPVLPANRRVFDALADWADDDFDRLAGVLEWAAAHRSSGLYLRQIPVPGIDTKWLEQRAAVVADFASALFAATDAAGRDLHALLGLTRPPVRLRLRVLCAELRHALGGLGDIEAPVAEVAALPLAPAEAIVVENLESGLALPERKGTVAFMKLGHAVGLLGRIPWLRGTALRYWGDIDTHGFAILDQARAVLPGLRSLLMDRETLLRHRRLWGEDTASPATAALERLTADEREVYEGLVAGTWGIRVRLEQERIPWAEVLEAMG